ncbi:zinc transporter ZntB [Pseudoalteromonas sp. GCY]|uniref:zinc transporter ZntB n=1 Tax=Pseudoalteromonas sp. GCY TaxID=2003316 RepID=UPI000BFEC88C|nr:zinc transporter ZntB [Pseudoalteromonas sp. GCY]PHI36714.1 zinc transporter ZntB [Pseudoalteromonas sp. GCY]QQQ66699.1 zinc transporter ZntB [Pseudoalteromonas sp. GCY]
MTGLLHAFVLDGQGGGRLLCDLSEVKSVIHKEPLWLHFDYSFDETTEWLKQQTFLDDWEREALTADETRPRTANGDEGLLVFLRGVNLNPKQSPEDMVSIRCFANDKLLITCRKRHIMSAQDMLASLKKGQGAKSIGELLSTLVMRLSVRMQDIIWQIEEQLDEFEDAMESSEQLPNYQQLSTLRRQTIGLKRYLKPQKLAISELILAKVAWLDEDHQHMIEEASNALSRYIEELEAAIERAQVIQNAITNHQNEQLNQRMYVMSVVAALFLPLGFLTGLLGVNIGGIPGTEWGGAFAFFVIMLVVLTGGIGVYFKRKGWL